MTLFLVLLFSEMTGTSKVCRTAAGGFTAQEEEMSLEEFVMEEDGAESERKRRQKGLLNPGGGKTEEPQSDH